MSYTNASYPESLRNLLDTLDEQNDTYVPGALKQNLERLLDTYDLSIQEDTDDMTKFKNYLARSNESMRKDLLDFIKRKSKVSAAEMKKVDQKYKRINCLGF